MAVTATIPIVFVSASDPVATGLVPSLNRPDGYVIGVSMVSSTIEAMAENAIRLCEADRALIFRFAGQLLQVVAAYNICELRAMSKANRRPVF
jgi:hypothetical protein